MGRDERVSHAALLDAGIPIVGKAFEIKEFYATVVIQCGCEGKNILVLIGPRNVVQCNSCQRCYAIAKQEPVAVGIVRMPETPNA